MSVRTWVWVVFEFACILRYGSVLAACIDGVILEFLLVDMHRSCEE